MDMQSLAGGTFDHVSLIEGGELDLEISQLNKANLVRMMYGSSAVIAAGPVTDESHIWAGSGPVLLNYIPDSAAIVVKDDAAAITYVLGTDYEVLEGRLGIQPLAGGAILSGDEIKVTYARKEQYDIETLTAANKEYRLFIVGLNKADTVDGDPQKITIHRIKFGPAGFDLVGDDFAKPSTKGTLLAAPEIVGGGWLADLGFHDFAGSTCVHMAGGVAAFVGAAILGPRIGKYDKNGKAKAIPGHSLTLGALGCFILWFCWFGFNGASTTSMEGDAIPLAGKVFVTTNLAAAVATITTMIFTWIKYKKPDVSMTLNASLAGLVAITAPCDTVSPVSAAIIGIVAGILVVVGVEFIDQVLKIDDPVGACGVHMLNGMWGTIAVGLFSDGTCGEKGLFTGGGAHLLGIQLLGMVSVIAWVAITMTIVFQIIKHTIGLRASEQEEILGLDVTEHGLVSSYADFAPAMSQAMLSYTKDDAKSVVKVDKSTEPVVPVEKAIKVESYATDAPSADGTPKMTKVAIICKQQKLNDLITALEDIDVTGVTVTNVLGCGMQKGQPEYYRGAVVETNLLPKVKVEVVICKVPTRAVIDAAKAALYTGHIGDGKIFVYNIENVVKIRTNEEGYDALQDD
jgi:Amt family ammonium transporter